MLTSLCVNKGGKIAVLDYTLLIVLLTGTTDKF